MRGISEEALKDMLREEGRLDIKIALNYLIQQCKELNPWLPIDENTPRNKPIKIYDSGYGQVVVSWNAYFRCFTNSHGNKYLSPTHYQELPGDPET